jgi:glycosyltransferase involved in cell wall biosynthesis
MSVLTGAADLGVPTTTSGVASPPMNPAVPSDLRASVHTEPWTLSVVVPACNAAGTLETTLTDLLDLPGGAPREIVVVENGSQDSTWELLERLQKDWEHPGTALIALRSERGIGAAYRTGAAVTSGNRVLLTADDLPFGSSDVEAVLACRSLPRFAIGSKAHPRSRVSRTVARRLATGVFRLARRLVLGLDVGDTQGTFLIDGELARRLVAATTVAGFGMTTELVALAAREGDRPVELPVVLRERHGPTRINWITDSMAMLLNLLQLRRRLGPARQHRLVVVRSDSTVSGTR